MNYYQSEQAAARANNVKKQLTSFHQIAVSLVRREKYDNALILFKLSLELNEKRYPEMLESINRTRYWIALSTQLTGNSKEAIHMFRNLHAELVERHRESHTTTLKCAREIGECLLSLGRHEDAMEILKHNMELANKNPSARVQLVHIQYSFAKVLLKMERHEEAISQFRSVLDEELSIYGESYYTQITRQCLAEAQQTAIRTRTPLKQYKNVYEKRKKALGPEHPNKDQGPLKNFIALIRKWLTIGQEDTLEKAHGVIPNKVKDDEYKKFTTISNKIGYSDGDLMGTGATGRVYQGYFETRDVRAAVKIMLSNQTRIYENEIKIMRNLNYPNIIRYFASESCGNSNYIVMELADQNLDDFVKATSQNPLNEICRLLEDTCTGLRQMHNVGIIHRDIKPQNILIFLKGGKNSGSKVLTAKIGDFGISKLMSGAATQSTAKGTPTFMSHECMKARDEGNKFRSTKESDIFSLGLTFYYALSYGKHACGSGSPERQAINLCEGKLFFDDLLHGKFAVHLNLVKSMLRLDPLERPPIGVICMHPFFWNNDRCLSFVNEVTNFMSSNNGWVLKTELVKQSFDWYAGLDAAVAKYLNTEKEMKRNYTRTSLMKLLKFIRDKNEHYTEWPFEVKQVWGEGSARKEQYMQYFADRFPFLIPHLYGLVQKFRSGGDLDSYYNCYEAYFDDSTEYLTTISHPVLQTNDWMEYTSLDFET